MDAPLEHIAITLAHGCRDEGIGALCWCEVISKVLNGIAKALDGGSSAFGMNTLHGFFALIEVYSLIMSSQ